MTFDSKVKHHLSSYKRNRLQVYEEGLFKRERKKYSYILPENLKGLNIIEIYRSEFWKYWGSQRNKNLHDGFYHLNSSQAMCFNLFFPLREAIGLRIVADIFSFGHEEKLSIEFEEVLDKKERTNVDVLIRANNSRVLLETKYTERNFGPTNEDERHQKKLKEIYSERIENIVTEEYRTGKKFFSNYQLIRYLSYLKDSNTRFAIVYPKANDALSDYLSVLDKIIEEDYRRKIAIIHLKDFVEKVLTRIPANEYLMKTHYELFKEKYLL